MDSGKKLIVSCFFSDFGLVGDTRFELVTSTLSILGMGLLGCIKYMLPELFGLTKSGNSPHIRKQTPIRHRFLWFRIVFLG